ncbi:MAG: exodeoxyribonuclease VII large subunit [Crocinitomicaceae bacterium]
MSANQKIFTLKQVVSSIRKTIEERYQQLYWVKVEMHKLNRFASGHCFPELLQKEDGKIVAQISGSIWNHNFERINKRFIEVVKEPLKEDTTLLMQVKVSFHETYGMSLQIMDIDPNYALGELQRERQETLKKLQKEGLINANQNVEFPLLPKRIAVISADSSKGLSDFMQVIESNDWGYNFFTMLFPAYLQGDNASSSIIKQLNAIKKVQNHFDAVVIVRGGGGEVGLSCYNEYELCKAIASFPLPVLTGIGHSTNLTVAEMISFRNSITPTELGDFLIQAFHNFSTPVNDSIRSIKVLAKRNLAEEHTRFGTTSQAFKHLTKQYLTHTNHVLLQQGRLLKNEVRENLFFNRKKVGRLEQQTVSSSKYLLQRRQDKVELIEKTIPQTTQQLINKNTNDLERMIHSIKLMDPLNVLKRGYSITTINGKTVSDSNKAEVGDEIITKTSTFSLTSIVKTKTKDNE